MKFFSESNKKLIFFGVLISIEAIVLILSFYLQWHIKTFIESNEKNKRTDREVQTYL